MRILVMGGTSGIGAALVRESLRAGHTLFATGRNRDRLDDFLESCAGLGPGQGAEAEAGDWDQASTAVEAATRFMGGIDVAVANAGCSAPGNLADGDPGLWRDMVLANVYGPAILAKATLPQLTAHKGHFVLFGSTAGRGRSIPATCTRPPIGPSPATPNSYANNSSEPASGSCTSPPATSAPPSGKKHQTPLSHPNPWRQPCSGLSPRHPASTSRK
jgi:NAD(P)-dependent dehydrogenase (short-subunit alcohol dehydrogenase family)